MPTRIAGFPRKRQMLGATLAAAFQIIGGDVVEKQKVHDLALGFGVSMGLRDHTRAAALSMNIARKVPFGKASPCRSIPSKYAF